MKMYKKLFDKKGFEWYHMLILAAIVGYLAYNVGVRQGYNVPGNTYCDTHNVEIRNREFIPQNLDIHPCDKVIWTNKDSGEYHTITFDTGPSSDTLNFKDSFTRTFNEKGTFIYYSEPYQEVLTGKIEVS